MCLPDESLELDLDLHKELLLLAMICQLRSMRDVTGRYPEPKSVIVMDNASWHHSGKILQMCREAGVVIEFLSPYSPDFNPIEEHFGVLKKFIKKKWYENKDFITREFKMFLE
jgi:transposase